VLIKYPIDNFINESFFLFNFGIFITNIFLFLFVLCGEYILEDITDDLADCIPHEIRFAVKKSQKTREIIDEHLRQAVAQNGEEIPCILENL